MKMILWVLSAVFVLSGSGIAQVGKPAPASNAKVVRTEDVIYGRKFGTALTLDVFEPRSKNGCAILFMVSGGFFSSHEAINPKSYEPFLNRGYTVFAIVHGSQPKFQIPEIVEDIHRAVRYVRHHADRWQLNPDKFGITGASAGGHLSLTMGTQGHPGKPDAKDPIDRRSSAVQAVACFFPPTDFLNWGEKGEDGVGYGPTAQFKPAFGSKADSAEGRQELGRAISPIRFVTSNMPPTLVIHGDADKLVPIFQARSFETKCREQGAPFQLVVRAGADHGWGAGMAPDMELFADWFDRHLRGITPQR
ncbi:MAG: hypothetical protein QOF48_504 [Verrucomicrobiota bacterium]|jgi:acetyl esterase/lipase